MAAKKAASSGLRPCPLPGFRLATEYGPRGNAFCILGEWEQAAKDAGVDEPVIKAVLADATSSDYKHLRAVLGAWGEEED